MGKFIFYSWAFNFLTPRWKVFCQLCAYKERWYWQLHFGSLLCLLEDLHIEVSVPSQETECICVLAILTLSVIFQLDLTVSENFTKSFFFPYHTCSLAVFAWRKSFNKKRRGSLSFTTIISINLCFCHFHVYLVLCALLFNFLNKKVDTTTSACLSFFFYIFPL
jgi:hypothetical protein